MKKYCLLHGYYVSHEKVRSKCHPPKGVKCQHLRNKFQSRLDSSWKHDIEPTPFDIIGGGR